MTAPVLLLKVSSGCSQWAVDAAHGGLWLLNCSRRAVVAHHEQWLLTDSSGQCTVHSTQCTEHSGAEEEDKCDPCNGRFCVGHHSPYLTKGTLPKYLGSRVASFQIEKCSSWKAQAWSSVHYGPLRILSVNSHNWISQQMPRREPTKFMFTSLTKSNVTKLIRIDQPSLEFQKQNSWQLFIGNCKDGERGENSSIWPLLCLSPVQCLSETVTSFVAGSLTPKFPQKNVVGLVGKP